MRFGKALIQFFSHHHHHHPAHPADCDQIGNKGAVCRLSRDTLGKPTFLVFSHVPHPPIRPMAYSSGMASLFGL